VFVPLAIPLNDDTVTPGFLGFGVVVALGVALFLLLRSMNKQISRIQAPTEADLKQAEWERANLGRTDADADVAEVGAAEESTAEPATAGPATAEPQGKKAD
jgi:hypothetical protein